MTPDQAESLKRLADVHAKALGALCTSVIGAVPPQTINDLADCYRAARDELHGTITSLTHPVMAVMPRGIDPDDADFVGINFDTAIALLDRELARSKA